MTLFHLTSEREAEKPVEGTLVVSKNALDRLMLKQSKSVKRQRLYQLSDLINYVFVSFFLGVFYG